jgi:hypothetical protein
VANKQLLKTLNERNTMNLMDFSQALLSLRDGNSVTRLAWRGPDALVAPMETQISRIYLVDGSTFTVNRMPLLKFYPEGTPVVYKPHIDALYSNGQCGVWTPTHEDLLACDWTTAPTLKDLE